MSQFYQCDDISRQEPGLKDSIIELIFLCGSQTQWPVSGARTERPFERHTSNTKHVLVTGIAFFSWVAFCGLLVFAYEPDAVFKSMKDIVCSHKLKNSTAPYYGQRYLYTDQTSSRRQVQGRFETLH